MIIHENLSIKYSARYFIRGMWRSRPK